MTITDPQALTDALADPQTLYVFGVIAADTSKLSPTHHSPAPNTITMPYITPFGLQKQTSLSRDAIEAAADRLKRVGVLDHITDHERGYESWRISETALADAATTAHQPRPSTSNG